MSPIQIDAALVSSVEYTVNTADTDIDEAALLSECYYGRYPTRDEWEAAGVECVPSRLCSED